MAKKAKNTIETIEQAAPIEEQTETCQEQPQEQSEPLSAQEQYYRAGDEIKRLKQEQVGKQQTIKDHMARIADIQEKHKEAQQAHSQAVSTEEEYKARLERQQALAKVGGPAEQAALQSMQAEQKHLAMLTGLARKDLDEAEKLLEEIPAITTSIEQLKADIDQIAREQAIMEDVRDELGHRWGGYEEDALVAEIKEAQEEFAAQEQAFFQARAKLNAVQGSVRKRLQSWPRRAEYVEQEYLQAIKKEDPSESPEERVFKAQIAYVEALGKWGPQCQVMLHRVYIAELLALPRNIIAELMHPRSGIWQDEYVNGQLVRTNHLIRSAQSHIDEARRR